MRTCPRIVAILITAVCAFAFVPALRAQEMTVDLKSMAEGKLQGVSQVEVSGVFRLHGHDHDANLAVSIQPAARGQLRISTKFSVPYIKWGLKNPSTFILRVSDTVELETHATARIGPASASSSAR